MIKCNSIFSRLLAISLSIVFIPSAFAGWETKPVKPKEMRRAIYKGGNELANKKEGSESPIKAFDEMRTLIIKQPWLGKTATESVDQVMTMSSIKKIANSQRRDAIKTALKRDIEKWSKEGALAVKKRYFDGIETQTGSKIGQSQRDLIWKELNSKGKRLLSKQVIYYKITNFDKKKDGLVREWELNNGRKWPRESNGWKYPVGKIISDENFGKATWWNITPAITGEPKQIAKGPVRSEAAILIRTILAQIDLSEPKVSGTTGLPH